jgi:group I intron endonuclease
MPYADKICGVYLISRIGTDECYVGQSVNIKARWRGHIHNLEQRKHKSKWLQRVFDKYGVDAFEMAILEICLDPSDKAALTAREQAWMDGIRPCYNTTPAAGSTFGYKFPPNARIRCSAGQKKRFECPEERKKYGLMMRGRLSPWKGMSASAETRAKMSAAKIGRVSSFKGKSHSKESRERISLARRGTESSFKGKSHSKASLDKMRLAKLGKESPNKGIPLSEEAKAKQSASMKAMYAKKRELANKG